MNSSKAHKIWIVQCEATHTIRARFGLKAAFDYIVGEKLINFTDAASRHRDFAQELPRFISEVRRMFTPEEIGAQLTRIERQQTKKRETFWTRTILSVRIRRVSRSELGGSWRSRNY